MDLRRGTSYVAGVEQHVISLSKNTPQEARDWASSSLIGFVSPVGPQPGLSVTSARSPGLQRKFTACSQRSAVSSELGTHWKTEKFAPRCNYLNLTV